MTKLCKMHTKSNVLNLKSLYVFRTPSPIGKLAIPCAYNTLKSVSNREVRDGNAGVGNYSRHLNHSAGHYRTRRQLVRSQSFNKSTRTQRSVLAHIFSRNSITSRFNKCSCTADPFVQDQALFVSVRFISTLIWHLSLKKRVARMFYHNIIRGSFLLLFKIW